MNDSTTDIDWRNLAVGLRTTLDHFGPEEHAKCLSGEPDRGTCPGTDEDHAAMFIAKLIALLEHFAHHLPQGPQIAGKMSSFYADNACEFTNKCPSHDAPAGALLTALGERAMTGHPYATHNNRSAKGDVPS